MGAALEHPTQLLSAINMPDRAVSRAAAAAGRRRQQPVTRKQRDVSWRMRKIRKRQKNKNGGKRHKNSENQVTLNSIFGPSKKHYLSNFVLNML
jgi:hypothetical protein